MIAEIEPYLNLMKRFLNLEISPKDFVKLLFVLNSNESRFFGEPVDGALDELVAAADAYEMPPIGGQRFDIDEKELRSIVQITYERLKP